MSYPFPRKELAAFLTKVLPSSWHIVDSHTTVDDVPKTIVKIKQTTISPFKGAPQGFHAIDFIVTISAPNQRMQEAEDRLDHEVNALLHALDDLAGLSWANAQKVVDDNRLAYDVSITISSERN